MTLEFITISDQASGSRAKILPAVGFNCFSFQPMTADGPLEVLWAAPDLLAGTARPSGSGIPLLFPFAGRIRGTAFRFEGKQYALEAGDGRGNALHGFVFTRPWRITHQETDRATAEFHASVDDPALLKSWPADFRIKATYQVQRGALIADYVIDNPDSKPLPFGFGTHPYFRIPLGGNSGGECRVTVPAEHCWELEGLLPTGRKKSTAATKELANGISAAAMAFDDVFSGLKFDNHRAKTTVHDPHSKRTMAMTFDDQFAACVVYNPPHREAVCIEPYTAIPDPFTLREQGIDPNLLVLAPGKSFRTRIEIRIE